ncbi:MAG: hypothetical protein HRU70_03085 [Phycisphaeraceae bacterium]|nr:MAG: hypothetical protein HRU70_03085 [Phycisphaeraceae bacterium]
MRPLPFAVLAWIMLGLDLGLRDDLRIGPHAVAPSFTFILLVVVASGAPAVHVAWASLVLGLAFDLASDWTLASGASATIIGPNALAFVLAAQLVVAMRALVFRKNPVTIAFLALLAGAVAQTLLVGLMTLRAAYDPVQWDASEQLGERLLSAVYTALLALPVSPLLLLAGGLLGFQPHTPRRIRVRGG